MKITLTIGGLLSTAYVEQELTHDLIESKVGRLFNTA